MCYQVFKNTPQSYTSDCDHSLLAVILYLVSCILHRPKTKRPDNRRAALTLFSSKETAYPQRSYFFNNRTNSSSHMLTHS
jgi:hypothetical protein